MIKTKASKPCEQCKDNIAISGKRFCADCQKQVLSELQEKGYLRPNPWVGHGQRTVDQKENTYETKHGSGHG